VKLHGNRELLGQALVNLVENALKYYEPVRGQGRAASPSACAAPPGAC
jgi:signal transduction histidine kinase